MSFDCDLKMSAKGDLGVIIKKLIDIRNKPPGTSAELERDEIMWLLQEVKTVFLSQPVLIELRTPLTVCGDIHGQYHDLLRLFEICNYPPETNYLFLGDYVDRGRQSIETVCLLFAFKVRYPENFFLLRGNHECFYINRDFGFYNECCQFYDVDLWRSFNSVFCCLPIAAIIENKIFCVHGGLSKSLQSMDDIKAIERPIEIPEEGLLCDLLWSDPDPDTEEWDANERGASYVFGEKPLREFLDKFGFDLVCRAHQAVMTGYDFPFSGNQGILTLFSAPNYCGEFDNNGAMLQINENLVCSFTVIKPVNWDEEYFVGPRPGTPPRGGTKPTSSSSKLFGHWITGE